MNSWLTMAIKENDEKQIESFFQDVKKIQNEKNEAFLILAQEGRLKHIQKFLTLGIDFTYEEEGWTALGVAAANGHLKIMKELAQAGADINHQSSRGWTPLMLACCNHQDQVVDWLIHQGAKLDLCDLNQKTALMCAAHFGSFKIVCRLIEEGADLFKKDNKQRDAYTIAMQEGHQEIAQAVKEAVKKKMKEIKTLISSKQIGLTQDLSKQKD